MLDEDVEDSLMDMRRLEEDRRGDFLQVVDRFFRLGHVLLETCRHQVLVSFALVVRNRLTEHVLQFLVFKLRGWKG